MSSDNTFTPLGPVWPQELMSRAYRAWYAYAERVGCVPDQPPDYQSGVFSSEKTGRLYAVVANCRGALCVFRVRELSDGTDRLKRLNRWPSALSGHFE